MKRKERESILVVPRDWEGDLRDQRSAVAAALFGRIELSHYPSLDIDPAELAADLSQGAVLHGSARGSKFTLIGEGFTVELNSRPGMNSGQPMAVISSARSTDLMLPKAGWFRAEIDVRPVYDEARCDLRRLWQVLGANGPGQRKPEWGARTRPFAALLERQYGALRQLLELLRARAENELVTSDCTVDKVLPGRPSRLLVRMQRHASEFEDARVKVEGGGLSWETKVEEIHGDTAIIGSPGGEPPTQLTMTKASRFAMRQNAQALRGLMDGDTAGHWADLAALMVQSDALKSTPPTPPVRFFADEEGLPLNPEQQAAVTSALSSPHAFFIQGPPGTGKTAVTCELIRQLAARGERVLLLAPSHVALDEALRRVGDKPGIRALRLSWNDLKVDEVLRRFLPDRVAAHTQLKIRRAATSRAQAWAAESVGIDRTLALIGDLGRVESRPESLLEWELELAESAAVEADKRLRAADAAYRTKTAELTSQLRSLNERAATAAEEGRKIHAAIADAEDAIRRDASAFDELRRLSDGIAQIRAALDRANADNARAREVDVQLSNQLSGVEGRIAVVQDRLAEAEAGIARDRYWAEQFRAELDRLGARTVRGLVKQSIQPDPRVDMVKRQLKGTERSWMEHLSQLQAHRRELDGLHPRRHAMLPSQQAARARVQEIEYFIGRTSEELKQLTGRWRDRIVALGGSPDVLPGTTLLPTTVAILNGAPLPNWLYGSPLASARTTLVTAREVLAELDALPERRAETETQLLQLDAEAVVGLARLRTGVEAAASTHDRARRALEDRRARVNDLTARLKSEAPGAIRDPTAYADEITDRKDLLSVMTELERRWCDVTGELSDQRIAEDIDVAYTRSANLVCATTAGIAGRGSEAVRYADFDTMILDEASRVTDSEFLIGALRSRRWVLVGDERQLPPHVDNQDERFLHALVALERHERGQEADLRVSVRHLSTVWKEEEKLRGYRIDGVTEYAQALLDSGDWERLYRKTFKNARRQARRVEASDGDDDVDRRVLGSIRDHLVHSLFERCVARYPDLRVRLVTQRRMIEPIARIVRDSVYGGEYLSPSTEDLAGHGIVPLTVPGFTAPVVFLDTSAQGEAAYETESGGTGFVNKLEASWIVRACQAYENHLRESDPDGPRVTVSVLCLYKAQADLIWRKLGGPLYPKFKRLDFRLVAPVDRSQGQESDLVVISFTRGVASAGQGFALWLQDLRRLNVACTRAHRALVLTGHRQSLSRLGATDARGFYQGLFELLDSPDPNYKIIKDLK
ncbi:DEAD/DEAH box helicase [Nonomuraea aurantiaca]|uniref:DEAD/DEAH box helicase n=1 Tax=Nonomuraea aurantiaca TaxID=2878562 RepID=UPI001CDA1703|nr:AAA domain-containing protein [Nonomuraea aurantiaca]MCA2228497.1 AAA family ATPase [Nonomuraea aurantiaca]